MEEDGFSLLREWLFPRVEGGLQAVQAPDADERSLEHALFQVLQGAVAAGARDLDIRTFWDPVGAGFAVAQFAHAADGPDFTQLKQLLEKKRRHYEGDEHAREKTAASLIRAGFEPELVFQYL